MTFFFCVCLKPKGRRFTTAKAPQNTTIDIEELMSPSEEEDEVVDEWRPEKPEKGRRVSKKPKATGVSSQTTLVVTDDHEGGTNHLKNIISAVSIN